MENIGLASYQDEDFSRFYDTEIVPMIHNAEAYRINCFNKFKLACLIGIPILIALYIGAFYLIETYIAYGDEELNTFLRIFLIMLGVNSFVIFFSYPKSYKKNIKKMLVNKVLNYCGDFNYVEEKISRFQIDAYNIFPKRYNKIEYGDMLVATVNGIETRFAELRLYYSRRKRSYDLFNGLLCSFKLNKNYTGHTMVINNNHFNDSTSNFYEIDPITISGVSNYRCFTNNKAEAGLQLTPEFFEFLTKINSLFPIDINCCFHEDELVLAIYTDRDFFEPPHIYQTLLDYEKWKKIIIEVKTLLSIVDYLRVAK